MADAYTMSRELWAFAKANGFTPPEAHYIRGSFNIKCDDGTSLYSDEAHLYCEGCADALLQKALPHIRKDEREDYFVCSTDAIGEDTCPHCATCGETLNGSISQFCVREELDHYAEDPIELGDTVNPRQAIEIAMVLDAAPEDPEALALGRAALAAIKATA